MSIDVSADRSIPYDELQAVMSPNICIVGVGNRQRGDDGVGPRVIERRDPAARGTWIDAGTAPENFIEQIACSKHESVLFIDAIDFGGFPGECRLLDARSLQSVAVSTHGVSFSVLDEYLSARAELRLLVLGVQPDTVRLGSPMSDPVARMSIALAERLSLLLSKPEVEVTP